MNSLVTGIISGMVACGVVTFITRKNTRGNEFHLYRLYSAYEGSNLSSTIGVYSDMNKAGEMLKSLEDSAVAGMKYGISKVIVNTFKGREGNTIYEWKKSVSDPDSYFFFTRSEYVEELGKRFMGADHNGIGEFKTFEIDR
ncbi:hypothetical protein [Butyrivibrio proteoclasticus]|uniref:hypothetical protein n=1 Tax=Butyrivibrio proteoclasticus TaxID=43305 RepID=UPI000479F6CF|nr:hypothetical protein [Butyrivibrio proteoclasticus]